MKHRSRGFTLMELMVVLALAGVILAIGAPSFREFRQNSRLTGIANDFLGAIQAARGEAIKRQLPVAVCASDNAEDDEPDCEDTTFNGWIVFVDKDNDCVRDDGEEVLRAQPAVNNEGNRALNAVSTTSCISFASTGFRQNAGGAPAAAVDRTVFCDNRGLGELVPGSDQSAGRGVEVTRTGRARVTRVVAEFDTWGIACPAAPETEPTP